MIKEKIPSKHLIVQHNDLLESKYDLHLSEMRLILEAVRNVEKDDEDFKEYSIDVAKFLKLIDTKNTSEYSRVRQFCKTILTKPLEIPQANGDFLYCNWFSSILYKTNEKQIVYSFDPKLKPYLIQLKDNFTKYDNRILMQFKSFYGLRIYMLLKTEMWKKHLVEYEIELDKLREMMKLEGKYKLYGHFKNRVLEIAKKYINDVSDIKIDYEDIKHGRKVVAIRFKVKRNEEIILEEKDEDSNDMNFTTFKKTVIEKYQGKDLCNEAPGFVDTTIISISKAGYLRNEFISKDLSPDQAKKVWEWLFSNKTRVGDIKEYSKVDLFIESLKGKKFKVESKSILGSFESTEYEIVEIIKKDNEEYELTLRDQYGSSKKNPKLYKIEEIRKFNLY